MPFRAAPLVLSSIFLLSLWLVCVPLTLVLTPRPAGFQSVYRGVDTQCTVKDLCRVTEYKFRLSASNAQGTGKYSPDALYATSAAAPSTPAPPSAVSRTQTSLTLVWEVNDDGGADIGEYLLEIDQGADAVRGRVGTN